MLHAEARNFYKGSLLWAVFILWSFPGRSQVTGDTLKAVNVIGAHTLRGVNDTRMKSFSAGQKIKTIDSIVTQQYQLQNIGNLLSQQVPVFVKSYGFNALATLNFRGSSSAQSIVVWNGIPINNAALGLADISQLPVSLFDKVSVAYGSSAALLGSGNVGGALILENDKPLFNPLPKTSVSAALGAGSFGQYLASINYRYSNSKWYFSFNSFGQLADNGFQYKTLSGDNTTNINSRLQSGSIMLQSCYRLNTSSTIGLSVWYQQYFREIPAALFESQSLKNEHDNSLRTLLIWDHKKKTTRLYAKAAFTKDVMTYEDNAIHLTTANTSYQLYAEIGIEQKLSEISNLLIYVPVQIGWIDIGYATKDQDRAALVGAYDIRFFNRKLNIAATTRGEVINTQSILLPGLGVSYQLNYWLSLRANVQRTYRAPTLNELYYSPGGNPSLKPEQGWNEDAGYTINRSISPAISIHHDVALYNREIRDWIIWFGGAIWTPHNIAIVRSQGIETENKILLDVRKWHFHLGVNTANVFAIVESSYIVNDNSIGKQIPYTPLYLGQLNVGFYYGQFYFNYNHTLTGYRYITTDQSEYLPSYNTGNIQLSYDATIHTSAVTLSVQINNIWNNSYEVVAYRPMPGINWLTGIKFRFN
ncbi:MAG: TonB-dependent receptor [Taibaiella sp.]|nr:TonB-dependent receptor [Taibaiella sp.]